MSKDKSESTLGSIVLDKHLWRTKTTTPNQSHSFVHVHEQCTMAFYTVQWPSAMAFIRVHAKVIKSNLAVALFDLHNALGSASHQLIFDMLSLSSIPSNVPSYKASLNSQFHTYFEQRTGPQLPYLSGEASFRVILFLLFSSC